MSTKKTGLGRSFDSLIPSELLDESFDPTAGEDSSISDLRRIKITEIFADSAQPRRSFDEDALRELAHSIELHGILQPIVVAPREGGGYTIVAGERRWRAAKQAGLDKLPSLVRTLSDQHKLELSLIENLQRRDLNVMETATAYLKLRDQFNLTLDEIGDRVGGKSVSAISNTLRLLRLPENVKQALRDGRLREGQARPLIGQPDDVINDLVPRIINESWSVRKIEQFIVQLKQAPSIATSEKITEDPYRNEATRFKKRFNADIAIRTSARGSGQIVIKFKNSNEFQRIAGLLDSN